MKSFWFTGLLAFGLLASCTNSDDDSDNLSVPNSDLPGVWKVAYFWDEKDETSDFNGYTFEFKSDGAFVVNVPGGGTQTGNWGERSDDGVTKFDIVLAAATSPLDELPDDWVLVEKTATSLKLRDDGDDSDEVLHFVRL